jgi:hypothetical protein
MIIILAGFSLYISAEMIQKNRHVRLSILGLAPGIRNVFNFNTKGTNMLPELPVSAFLSLAISS